MPARAGEDMMAINKIIKVVFNSGDFWFFFMISPFHKVSDWSIFIAFFCRLQVGYLETIDYVNDFLDVPGVWCLWSLWIYRCFGVIMVFRKWFWIYREM